MDRLGSRERKSLVAHIVVRLQILVGTQLHSMSLPLAERLAERLAGAPHVEEENCLPPVTPSPSLLISPSGKQHGTSYERKMSRNLQDLSSCSFFPRLSLSLQ